MIGLRSKWLLGLMAAALLALSPGVASANLIHAALYDWFDTNGDNKIDYVRVSQTNPTTEQFVFDMNFNVVTPNLTGLTPLVEVLQKFFDGPQGKDPVLPDFQWTVLHDDNSLLPDFESFHLKSDVGDFAVPNTKTGNLGGSTIGSSSWAFSKTAHTLDWEAKAGDELIDGQSGEFRLSVKPFISWEYNYAWVDWTDPNTQEKVYLQGITSVPTPEPATMVLAVMALPFGILGYRRRQRRLQLQAANA